MNTKTRMIVQRAGVLLLYITMVYLQINPTITSVGCLILFIVSELTDTVTGN